jgi:hypothetical protein
MELRTAQRKQAKIKLAIEGKSLCKTKSALILTSGISNRSQYGNKYPCVNLDCQPFVKGLNETIGINRYHSINN